MAGRGCRLMQLADGYISQDNTAFS